MDSADAFTVEAGFVGRKAAKSIERIRGKGFKGMAGRFISIRSKIFGLQMMVAALVIVVMSALGLKYYSELVHDKVHDLLEQNNGQAIENIEIILDNAVRLTEYPMLNKMVSELLSKDYGRIEPENQKYEQIRATQEIYSAIYAGIFYNNAYIRSVEWSAENTGTIHAVGVSPVGGINTYEAFIGQDWYLQIQHAQGLAVVLDLHRDEFLSDKGQYIAVGRSMVPDAMSDRSVGVIKLNIKVSALKHILELSSLADRGVTVLTDRNGAMICYTDGVGMTEEEAGELVRMLDYGERKVFSYQGEKYEGVVRTSERYGWKLFKIIPYQVMYEELIRFRQVLCTVLAVILLLLVVISYLLADSITKPLLVLSRCLEEMKVGNWNIRAKGGNDETGVLAGAFNAMAGRIQESVDAIYRKEEEKRRAELLALQAQINPHFLYNTLRSIRWMADVQGADNVTGAIDDLIQLFRLTTQIQGEYITIEEDLHIIRLYCEILMIRYMDCFTVEYEVDKRLLSCRTIKFLLQPLLENAIYHGFEDWKKNALIRISVREEKGDVVFEVYDNGCGMDAETIRQVLSVKKEDGKGLNKIGVNNVNMRIQRSFGEEYGLSFESEPGRYTIARARIPRLVMEGTEAS